MEWTRVKTEHVNNSTVGNILSYRRCYIWQKLACRVYYSYL